MIIVTIHLVTNQTVIAWKSVWRLTFRANLVIYSNKFNFFLVMAGEWVKIGDHAIGVDLKE